MAEDFYTLYDFPDSGNGYKVRLILNHLHLPYRYRAVDILAGESKQADFLALNPNGKIPVLQLADGRCLAESNAILWYLGEDTPLIPADPWQRAQLLQWMFFEQYSHEPNIATSRFILKHTEVDEERRLALEQKRPAGYAALDVMERHLNNNTYFVTDFSIADIALFAYTHVAEEGGFSLAGYPGIQRWLTAVRSQPNHCSIDAIG